MKRGVAVKSPRRCVYCGQPVSDRTQRQPLTCPLHRDLPAKDPAYAMPDQWPEAAGHEGPHATDASSSLCYAKGGPGGVHLTLNGRFTLCGLPVYDEPTVPRTVEPLSCKACYEADHARYRYEDDGDE